MTGKHRGFIELVKQKRWAQDRKEHSELPCVIFCYLKQSYYANYVAKFIRHLFEISCQLPNLDAWFCLECSAFQPEFIQGPFRLILVRTMSLSLNCYSLSLMPSLPFPNVLRNMKEKSYPLCFCFIKLNMSQFPSLILQDKLSIS